MTGAILLMRVKVLSNWFVTWPKRASPAATSLGRAHREQAYQYNTKRPGSRPFTCGIHQRQTANDSTIGKYPGPRAAHHNAGHGPGISAGAAQAVPILNAAGDYLPGYIGRTAWDLDILSSQVTYNAATNKLEFQAPMKASICTSPNAFYVWGVDRDSHVDNADFASHGFGGVLFNSVVILRPSGAGNVTTSFCGGGGALPAGAISINGGTIRGEEDASLLPSTGAPLTAYGWNLWSRDGQLPAGFGQTADFGVDNATQTVFVAGSTVAEPAGLSLPVLRMRLATGRRGR